MKDYIEKINVTVSDTDTGEILQQENNVISIKFNKDEDMNNQIDFMKEHIVDFNMNQRFFKKFSLRDTNKVSFNSMGVFYLLINNIQPYTNISLNENNKPIRTLDIYGHGGLKRNTVSKCLKELDDFNWIRIKGKTKGRKIYINPHYVCFGTKIKQDTLDMFT